MNTVWQTLLTAVSASALWEAFKFFYPDLTRYFAKTIEAKKTFYNNIDPILKSTGELYGKLLSLANEDFATFINPANSMSSNPDHNKKYIYYLFAQFWAQIEFMRVENQFTTLSKLKKGKQLLQFMTTFESRKYRLLDRSVQRIIGELMIVDRDQKFKVMTLNEFMIKIEDPASQLHKWIALLDARFGNLHIKENRQGIILFGLIIAAMIDHFDPDHKIVRQRPYFTNKLSISSKKTIKNNLMKYYLTFIVNKQRYYT